ncbi:MAG: cell division protein ZapE, partial [Rhodospirillaceae bacterium]|nr:cell division protein ZapE [Rhodospirillaceae bacterium]
MSDGPYDRYMALCAAGELSPDPVQESVAARLQALASALAAPRRETRGLIGRLLSRDEPANGPRGIYLHGGVGRGKSMLMDLFFETVPVTAKRRVHFHAFMQEVHRTIHLERQSGRHDSDGDTISAMADAVTRNTTLLCFDEFHVTDIADAMILGRLFEQLFRRGIVVVATSNRHPRDLYAGGINRQLFLPFIAMLEERLEIIAVDTEQDYRMAFLAEAGVYRVPADAAARAALDTAFARLVGEAEVEAVSIEVQGRMLEVPRQARHVARFNFEELCDRPLGSADYLALTEHFHTLVIDDIP